MTGKQRLKVLANYLMSGAVDEDEFNMENWPSCAIGEGTRIPSLSKEGLDICYDEPIYNGETGFEACASFFSMPLKKAEHFFRPDQRSPFTVGRQLLAYLRK